MLRVADILAVDLLDVKYSPLVPGLSDMPLVNATLFAGTF
jgi:hypothetical protein